MEEKKRENEKRLFTKLDYQIVRKATRKLPRLMRRIVVLRFWGNLTLEEIGFYLGVSDRVVERVLEDALTILRGYCLRERGFSRSVLSILPEALALQAA
jgi:DNA-directed RNA polymerase specialized sigma subunit